MASKAQKEQWRQKAKERRDKLSAVWKTVAAMSDAERAQLLEKTGTVTMCDGHLCSTNNTLFLAAQLPTVSVVGGFDQWRQFGRHVKLGETGLGIWIPKRGKKKDDAEADDDTPSGFFMGSVFDITQTEENEPPEEPELLSVTQVSDEDWRNG